MSTSVFLVSSLIGMTVCIADAPPTHPKQRLDPQPVLRVAQDTPGGEHLLQGSFPRPQLLERPGKEDHLGPRSRRRRHRHQAGRVADRLRRNLVAAGVHRQQLVEAVPVRRPGLPTHQCAYRALRERPPRVLR